MVIAVGGALGHMGKAVTKLAEEKELEIRCEFCEKVYHIGQKEIQGLLGHVEDQG